MSGGGALAGKVALITGGTQGIGRAVGRLFVRQGARLVFTGRRPERVAATLEALRAEGIDDAVGLTLDVRSAAEVEAMARTVLERFGRIDLLVACAGILRAPGTPPRLLQDLPPEEWDAVIETDLHGLFLTNRAVLPAMIRQGGGDIVNLASKSGRQGVAMDGAYCAAKFGVVSLTESIADEARPHGIRVQAVLPGTFDSEVWEQNGPLPRPRGLPPVDRVADLILAMVTLPPDVCLAPVVIEPVGASAKFAARPGAHTIAPGAGHPAAGGGRLAGQVVVVTGGTGGIGLATCRAAAREGASVVVADLDPERIEQAVKELEGATRTFSTGGSAAGAPIPAGAPAAPGTHLGVRCDVRSDTDCRRLAATTLERFGRIDALVACAGVLRGPGGAPRPAADTTPEEWRHVLDVNLRGTYLSNRAVLPAMTARHRGSIINVASLSGLKGRAHDAPYCASKAGILGLSESILAEVRRHGVRVQAILPDVVDTPLWRQNGPVPRPGDALPPERIADLIVFMLTQPDDTMLVAPAIAPLRARRRKPAAAPAGTATATAATAAAEELVRR